MPYDIVGFDSAGERHAYVMDDLGGVTGADVLLTDWLTSNPLPPIEGDSPTDTELEAIRQHVSKLLSLAHLSAQPPAPEDVPAPPSPDAEV